MSHKNTPIENPRMRALRTAHHAHASVRANLLQMKAALAFEKIGIDLDGLARAILILEAVDAQVVTAYGKLCFERDTPSVLRRKP